MNYSDDNQQGLMSLLAASQSGLDPTQAYGIMQQIQADQQAQNQQRQERQAGLLGMLQDAAMGGMPYAGAEAMLDAAPGPMGPALQAGLSAMYPDGGPPPTNASGAVMDIASSTGGSAEGMWQSMPGVGQGYDTGPATGPDALSPTFVPPEPSFSDQQAMMEMEQQQALQGDLTGLQQDAAAARAQEWTVDDFIAKATSENPELFATAPEEVMAIIENTFGATAVEMRGMPTV